MFTVYCDDSGTDKKNRVATVAGYIGKVGRWEDFNKEWQKALNDFHVYQMHRSDLENFGGKFKAWNPTRRTKFLQRVQPIIRDHITFPIGCAVIKEDYERIIPPDVKKQFSGVYGWCARDCLAAMTNWYQRKGYRNAVRWVFEAGTTGHGQVDAMFDELYRNPITRQKYFIKGWSFEDKSTLPLQSADVLAYEVFKQVENQILDRGKRPVRLSLKHLVHENDDRYLQYWGERRLLDWLDLWTTRGEWLPHEAG
jgi:hypothetical protein